MSGPQSLVYEDFVVKIDSDGQGGFVARLLRSPYGSTEAPLAPPFSVSERVDLLSRLEEVVYRSGPAYAFRKKRDVEVNVFPPRPNVTAEDVGGALFDTLFTGPILDNYLRSLGSVEAKRLAGLRIRLVFDPSRPELADLSVLPWELLYRRQTREFLSRSTATPVVRYLEVSQLTDPPLAGETLRVLVAMASPRGYPPLDLAQERDRITRVWGRRAAVEAVFKEHTTLSDLRQTLQEHPFQVLHFMGHGSFDNSSGSLLFEKPSGEPEVVTGEVLAESLRGLPLLRLVVLNACETARFERGESGRDPFTGVATALVLRGVPAVIAMQFPISDKAAVVFSEALYAALFRANPIDMAVSEARLAVYQKFPGTLEWVTPVLFSGVSDGRLFLPPPPPPARPEVVKGRFRSPWLYLAVAILLGSLGLYRWRTTWGTDDPIHNPPQSTPSWPEEPTPKPPEPIIRIERSAKDVKFALRDLQDWFEIENSSWGTCGSQDSLILDVSARKVFSPYDIRVEALVSDAQGAPLATIPVTHESFVEGATQWSKGDQGRVCLPLQKFPASAFPLYIEFVQSQDGGSS